MVSKVGKGNISPFPSQKQKEKERKEKCTQLKQQHFANLKQ